MYQNVHPSIFWSILRENGANTPDQDLESYKSILIEILRGAGGEGGGRVSLLLVFWAVLLKRYGFPKRRGGLKL